MVGNNTDPRDIGEERIRQIMENRQIRLREIREMERRMEEARREVELAAIRAQEQERRRVEVMRYIDAFLDRREP